MKLTVLCTQKIFFGEIFFMFLEIDELSIFGVDSPILVEITARLCGDRARCSDNKIPRIQKHCEDLGLKLLFWIKFL